MPRGYLRYRFLVGPTASGKTAVALALARFAPIEAISMDSMQVFRGMDIGTAKPTAAERAVLPHHGIDLVTPAESFNVARYLALAESAAAAVEARGALPLFVGGTGLYLRALTHGLLTGAPPDARLREELHRRAREEGGLALHRELAAVDPVAASRLHPNDVKRVVRALEVWRLTGCPISELQSDWANPRTERDRVLVGLRMDLDALHRRIARRVEAMFARGLVVEVARIRDGGGFGPQSAQALGYREVLDHLDGRLSLEECRLAVIKATRAFARRQRTWFRSYPDLRWIDVGEDDDPRDVAARVAVKLEIPPLPRGGEASSSPGSSPGGTAG
ncbi:MAG TPA: tRNA (adenosine(37)-N6)-dimethylallyltransferase MiaA [Planctomycetota bacterium]|nr:tRNA (adenosine(37)-N6)-dimethylallyltransferase MiaA [Planctomycetota bacterium]